MMMMILNISRSTRIYHVYCVNTVAARFSGRSIAALFIGLSDPAIQHCNRTRFR